jgi:hypothetical protein
MGKITSTELQLAALGIGAIGASSAVLGQRIAGRNAHRMAAAQERLNRINMVSEALLAVSQASDPHAFWQQTVSLAGAMSLARPYVSGVTADEFRRMHAALEGMATAEQMEELPSKGWPYVSGDRIAGVWNAVSDELASDLGRKGNRRRAHWLERRRKNGPGGVESDTLAGSEQPREAVD